MDTELSDNFSEFKANSLNTESSQENKRIDQLEEYFKSLHVIKDLHYISPDELKEHVQSTSAEVDYSKIIDDSSRVLLFGEIHSEIEPKFEVSRGLWDLKKMGYTAVAMESIGTDHQDLLTRYLESGEYSDRDELQKYLNKVCENDYGRNVAWSYKELIEALRFHKLKGIALNTIFQDKQAINEQMLKRRDERMTEPLLKYLEENTSDKVIVLTGAAHASRAFTNNMAGILNNHGVISQSVMLLGEEKEVLDESTRAIRDSVFSRSRVMIPNPGVFPLQVNNQFSIPASFDYIIHVPHHDDRVDG